MDNHTARCHSPFLPGLPAYEGGRVANRAYDAGFGLHGLFHDGKPFRFEWQEDEAAFALYLRRFERSGYRVTERTGTTRTLTDGKSAFVLEKDGANVTLTQTRAHWGAWRDEASAVYAVLDTSEQAFLRYIDALTARGLRVDASRRVEDNLFVELSGDHRLIFAAYFGRQRAARFCDDRVSAPPARLNGGEPIAGEDTLLCQFGLYYAYMRPGVSANCGMLYIIKLPDRSLFVIDGGEYEQATDAACAEVLRVMRQMSRREADEPVVIAAWFCTHAHDDHIDLFAKLLRLYHAQIRLERVLFNFPSNAYYTLMPQTFFLLDRLHDLYPDALYAKLHGGQRLTLAGVRFDVLQTHEDAPREAGDETIGGFNDTSTVLKITLGGASFLLLGDLDLSGEAALLSRYGAQTLRSTAVQAAHHLINRLERAYPVISPDIALVPQHIRRAIQSNEKYLTLLKTVPYQNQYYASAATDLFRVEDGGLRLIDRLPIVGGVYDQSDV